MSLFRLILIPLALVSMAACQTTTSLPAPPKFSASAYDPMALNARKLDIVNNWQMPMKNPYQQHLHSPNPTDILNDWASRVLLPAGGSGELTLDVIEASVTLTDLAKSETLLDSFSDQQESLVRVTYHVMLIWLQPVGGQQGAVELRATASQSLPESARPADYDVAIQDTILSALAQLDNELRAEIQAVNGLVLP